MCGIILVEVVQESEGIAMFKGIQAPYVDPGHKGSKEEMVGDAVLHLKGRSGLDHQRLAHVVEGSSSQDNNQTKGESRGRTINKDK
jgi:hypothetical protein